HVTTSRHCGLSQRRCVAGSMVMHPFRLVGPGFKSDRLRSCRANRLILKQLDPIRTALYQRKTCAIPHDYRLSLIATHAEACDCDRWVRVHGTYAGTYAGTYVRSPPGGGGQKVDRKLCAPPLS